MKGNHAFRRITLRYLPWLVAELAATWLLASVIVKGTGLISGAIDALLSGKDAGIEDASFLGRLALFVGVGFLASVARDLCASRFSVGITQRFRKEAGLKLARLEFKYFDDNASGAIMNKLSSDLGEAGRFFADSFPSICRILIEAATIIVSIGRMDPMLILFLALAYPLILLVSHRSSMRIANLVKNRWQKIDALDSTAYDNIQGIAVGRSFNLAPMMEEKIREANDGILQFEYRRNKLSSVAWAMQLAINWLPNIILATLAFMRVMNGFITVGEMTYFVLMLGRIIQPMSELPSLFNASRESGVSIQRLEELMGQPEEAGGKFDGNAGADSDGSDRESAIEFEAVRFAYGEEHPVLDDVNFAIRSGERVAFVGGSGEGKSTIFRLLCGFYRNQSGNYRLYGRDFAEWDLGAARRRFSLVSQNVFLFPQSIADNVACGRPGATPEEIQEACRLANIHDFIMSLPKRYDTQAGERGARLSGGERQRISIARAFLKDAPILLLDEPTSAIDVGTEDQIKEAILSVSRGRTVVTIAHRLSTIEDADRIMVLSGGRIAESGRSGELLARKGVYHRLYELQRRVVEREAEGAADGAL